MALNPWSTKKVASADTPATPISDTPDYPVMENVEYAVPSLESGSPYNDEFGWAPRSLRPSAVEYPSAQRLRTIPRYDFVPEPTNPPAAWFSRRDADTALRHSVEFVDADGWSSDKGILHTDRRFAEDPRRTPPPEPRITSAMAPRSYVFERPFDQGYQRTLNGNHFSMADHRRNYDIQTYGMEPIRSRRNTYRIEPAPWDANIVDTPPETQPVYARNTGQSVPSGSRTWRLS